jgi:PAS domain S-box-containing protein
MLKQSQNILLLSAIIIATLCLATLVAQQRIQKGLKNDTAETLHTIVDTSHQAIKSWANQKRATTLTWAEVPTIRQITRSLLDTPQTPQALQAAPQQIVLYSWLEPVLSANNYKDFCIISRDGLTLSSSQPHKIGSKHQLAQHPAFLAKILAGETTFSPAQKVRLSPSPQYNQAQQELPIIFTGAPIFDEQRNIIAILSFSISLAEDFTAILQRGRLGRSGETYAFNSGGQMISNSRFENQLHDIGLLKPEQHSALNIYLRNPGYNLLNGKKPASFNRDKPLTLMAEQAIAGYAGLNLEGYRDYRGVPVIGTWVWDKSLMLGITTEIDATEAFEEQRIILYTVYGLLALSVLLLGGLSAYFIVSRKNLLQSEQQFRLIVEESPFPIAITDLQGNIEHLNKRFVESFGWSSADARTQDEWLEILYPDAAYRDQVRHAWESSTAVAITNHSEIEPQQWKLTCKNGEVRDIEFRMTQIGSRHLVIAMHDLTERLNSEKEKSQLRTQLLQAQKMEAIGQIAGGVAHDFNNILTSIRGFAELTKAAIEDRNYAKTPNYLQQILGNSEKAANLVATLLAYSRDNKRELRPRQLPPAILNALITIKPLLPTGIVVNTHLANNLPNIMMDDYMLNQAISNLCLNARDAMNNTGQINIEAQLSRVNDATCLSCNRIFDGTYVELSVADTGCGIDEEIIHRIFDPFFTTREIGKSSGMGLSFVHGMIHSHHGHILVESEPGKGARFRLFFPPSQ